MIEVSTIGSILDVANKLWTLRGSLAKAGNDRRIAIASYLGDVATSIASIATALKTSFDADVAQASAELKTYAELGGELLSGVLPETEIASLTSLMVQPSRVLMATHARRDVAEGDRVTFISTLDEAAGRLRATSNILRVGEAHWSDGKAPKKPRLTMGGGKPAPVRSADGSGPWAAFARFIPHSRIGKVFFWIAVFYVVCFVLYGLFYAMGLVNPSCDFSKIGCSNPS